MPSEERYYIVDRLDSFVEFIHIGVHLGTMRARIEVTKNKGKALSFCPAAGGTNKDAKATAEYANRMFPEGEFRVVSDDELRKEEASQPPEAA